MIPPMRLPPESLNSDTVEFFKKLADLYAEMDACYDRTARAYGFECNGCADNCCQTRFYHHTHIERAYFLSGFFHIAAERREALRQRARDVVSAWENGGAGAERMMCPVNESGWCLLYAHRPMICRLHGLAHELQVPGRAKTFGPGCGEFDRLCREQAYVPFDRTPFYTQMAALEQAFKATAGLFSRLRQTVAEMIVDAENPLVDER